MNSIKLRDLIMFLAGLGGFIHEGIQSGTERPFFLTACMALMGLPVLLGADVKLVSKKQEKQVSSEQVSSEQIPSGDQ